MKKVYATIVAIASSLALSAQNFHVTFENVTVNAQGYNNGTAGTFSFMTNGIPFSYSNYTTYWNGTAVSNVQNTTTPGYANEFASRTGSGHNSEKYGVFYFFPSANDGFNFSAANTTLDSMFISNSTLAALDMQNGTPGLSKVFGSSLGADGMPDGTNGSDFFFLRIYGLNTANVKTDSTDVYLADFRSSNPANDYILSTWKKVIFAGFDNISIVQFQLFSSDNHPVYGMNTPAYFVFDDIYAHVGAPSTAEISELEAATFNLAPNPTEANFTISGGKGIITVYNAIGEVVTTTLHNESTKIDGSFWNSGLYLIDLLSENGTHAQKRLMKN